MALTGMMRQYLSVKEKNKDAILFFRLGDFYEMFFEDAKLVSKELELTLTGKDCGLEERAPMCGIPYHAAEGYIDRLIRKGYKVAICEQLEDPKLCKNNLVERGIIRVVTPGTLTEQSMLNEKKNNFLLAICVDGKKAGYAYTDISTGECSVFENAALAGSIQDEIERIAPTELLMNAEAAELCQSLDLHIAVTMREEETFQKKASEKRILKQFRTATLDALGISNMKCVICACGALLSYLEETQLNGMEHLNTLHVQAPAHYMMLDASARRNLEITHALRDGSTNGTLLEILDKTNTSMGARLLRVWVEQPLCNKEEICERLDAVEELCNEPIALSECINALKNIRDIERLIGKIAYNSLGPKHCIALQQSFEAIPLLRQNLDGFQSVLLTRVIEEMDPLEDLSSAIAEMIDPDAPALISEGGVIRRGFCAELDELRDVAANGRQLIAQMEQRERDKTGIKTLRIVYNKVFGYCIEVTKSYYDLVPMQYVRRQTLSNCERYTTEELQQFEKQLMGASDNAMRMESELFLSLKEKLAENIVRMQKSADAIKILDALCSFARCAQENNYVKPEITEDGTIMIEEGRHPVVERMLERGAFVPNDTLLDTEHSYLQIVTGPNMAGKSTYMRQTALIVLMSHIGSFVPAHKASVTLTDRIFTRIGASDNVAGGQSTFLVEMSEMAYILRNLTARSLLILDEVGRGTSTFDGLSIAWAIVEHLSASKIRAKTLFATHYHELTELEGQLPGVENYRIAVREHGEDVIFLRKIEKGGADKSFGVYVARLAGIPKPVVARAQEILARLEVANEGKNSISASILRSNQKKKQEQMSLGDYGAVELVEELRGLDVNSMTPMEAMNRLFLLREKARTV